MELDRGRRVICGRRLHFVGLMRRVQRCEVGTGARGVVEIKGVETFANEKREDGVPSAEPSLGFATVLISSSVFSVSKVSVVVTCRFRIGLT